MKGLIVIAIFLLCYKTRIYSCQSEQEFDLICAGSGKIFTSIFLTPASVLDSSEVHFYLGLRNAKNGIRITDDNIKNIGSELFDPTLRTSIIVHGFLGDSSDKWVGDLKNKLLEYRKTNVILVDWGSGKRSFNYTNAVRNCYITANSILKFFESMQANLKQSNSATNILWNNIHCIGHSLGAQICGQAARLIQKNRFFNVERITGLDPARPCFINENRDFKLDRNDAKFVDIIHTEAGTALIGLGLRQNMGHVDYYVNGGVIQPSCNGRINPSRLLKQVCSHFMACFYFIESISAPNSARCRFEGYRWDETYGQALVIFDQVKKGQLCPNCPEMGINAVDNQTKGVYLVLTSTDKPQCNWRNKDIKDVLNALEEVKEL